MNDNYSYRFNTFKGTWEAELSLLATVLRELHKDFIVLQDWDIVDLIKPEQIEPFQRDWLRLYDQLGEIEKDFYKEYWVPGVHTSYSYFINLSSDMLTMRADYYQFQYHGWVPLYNIDLCDIVINHYTASEIENMKSKFIREVTIPRERELEALFHKRNST